MIFVSPRLCRFFAGFSGFKNTARAVTVFPFIFVRSKTNLIPWLINHERIHLRQQMELLIIVSVIIYILEFLWAFLILQLSWKDAYLWTSAEQEAYLNQNNPDYLKQRNLFKQFYYIKNKVKFSHMEGVVTRL